MKEIIEGGPFGPRVNNRIPNAHAAIAAAHVAGLAAKRIEMRRVTTATGDGSSEWNYADREYVCLVGEFSAADVLVARHDGASWHDTASIMSESCEILNRNLKVITPEWEALAWQAIRERAEEYARVVDVPTLYRRGDLDFARPATTAEIEACDLYKAIVGPTLGRYGVPPDGTYYVI
jgi:hypothetical protein